MKSHNELLKRLSDKKVLVIGGGIAGLTSAIKLSELGISVDLVEKSPFLGGHAAQLSCKATDECMRCGACIPDQKIAGALYSNLINIHLSSELLSLSNSGKYRAIIKKRPSFIDPDRCNNCGACFRACPEPGAITSGFSHLHHPFFALDGSKCLNSNDGSCSLCSDVCPEEAIDLKAEEQRIEIEVDTIILASGFSIYEPFDRPYGYGHFKNVITHLEFERIIKNSGKALRPSDKRACEKIAFIQCVGSRDIKLNHPWCSVICCDFALKMAGLLTYRQPSFQPTIFYIDIQADCLDSAAILSRCRDKIRLVRAIPGDILEEEDGSLKLNYWNDASRSQEEEVFDMVVLASAILPQKDMENMAGLTSIELADSGFAVGKDYGGIFTAGAVTGPKNMEESMASAGEAVLMAVEHLLSIQEN